MIGFLVFALVFVVVLTLTVRLLRLRVREDPGYSRTLALTLLFIGIVLAGWWFLTRGEPGDRIVQPLILPSPVEVVKAVRAAAGQLVVMPANIPHAVKATTRFKMLLTMIRDPAP